MKKTFVLTLITSTLLYSCNSNQSAKESSTELVEISETATSLRLEKIWETDTLLTTSESVLYNINADLLYVSNINGQPLEKDGNGYISQVDLDGNIINQKWVVGLDAPKGMGLMGDKLYVTDISQLVEIDIKSAEITNRWEVEGANFLNDITIDEAGTVYFSDSGTNKIHLLTDGVVSTYLEGAFLASPNGLLNEKGRIMLTTMGASNFGYIDKGIIEYKVKVDNIGDGDGVVADGDGHYLISDWSGEIFHINGETWEKTSLLKTKQDTVQSADIEFVVKSQLLLVPTFFKNTVVAYRLIEE